MSRPSVEQTARLAVVGAETVAGACLRAVLAEQGIPGRQVDLFGATGGEVVLSEYDGEARLIQEPDTDQITGHDVVFLCEGGASARRVLRLSGPDRLIIDATGGLDETRGLPVIHMDINPAVAHQGRRELAVPHALSCLLAEVLHPLQQGPGVAGASAVLMRPAADHGEAGLEELRDQTVRLLNFATVPTRVFGRQLTFNVIPQHLMGDEADLEGRVADEVTRLLAWPDARLALQLVHVPVFHGHAASIWLEPEVAVSRDELSELLSERCEVAPPTEERATPLGSAGRPTAVTVSAGQREGGWWLWVVAGEAGNAPAEQAVRLARELAGF